MDEQVEQEPPVVFISYSHDSEDHKTWVREFATALRNVGIDVILDQWEIGPGDDVSKFMEISVRRALRVIMVCTEQYVRKANDGKGGAGYEVMVVTGELVADLGTKKFVPIIRQTRNSRTIPSCVSTRYFVDFSVDASFQEKLEELARSIQNAPRFEKPQLGKNPYAHAATGLIASPSQADIADSLDPIEIYKLSVGYANGANFAKWRELIHGQKKKSETALVGWRADNERNLPSVQKDLPAFFLPAVSLYGNLFAAAFGAFDSQDERFHNQLSLLDWMRNPKDWQRSGISLWTDLPELILFTYQALLGGLAMSRLRPEMAFSLAMTPISDRYQSKDSEPLFKDSRLVGWPESLNHHCGIAWLFLQRVAKEWEWLWTIFGSEEDTMIAIASYYLLLNTVDFVSAAKIRQAGEDQLRQVEAPLFWVIGNGDLDSRIRTLFFSSGPFIFNVLNENGISPEYLPGLWTLWMNRCREWLAAVNRDRLVRSVSILHHDLPTMLNRGSGAHIID